MHTSRSLGLRVGSLVWLALLTGGCEAVAPRSSSLARGHAVTLQVEHENSPREAELAFVDGFGLVDGTNCDAWPKDFVFGANYPSGAGGLEPEADLAPPLSDQVPGALVLQRAGFLERLQERLTELGLDRATVFGSKYPVELRTLPDPIGDGDMAVALDPTTLTGFALSRAWVCTEALARSEHCETFRVDVDTGGDAGPLAYAILVRSSDHPLVEPELEEARFLALLAAPALRVEAGVVLDTDTLLVTDRFTNDGAWFFEPRLGLAPVSRQAGVGQDLSAVPRPGFIGVVAEELLALNAHVFNGGGADVVDVSPNFSRPELAGPRRGLGSAGSITRISPRELFAVEVDPRRPTDHVDLMDLKLAGQRSIPGGMEWGMEARAIRRHETLVTLRPRHALREVSAGPGPIFIACHEGPSCELGTLHADVQRYASPPLRIEGLDLEGLFDKSIEAELEPLVFGGQCQGRELNPDGGFHRARNGVHTFVFNDGREQACSSPAQCARLRSLHPEFIEPCVRHDQVRVCFERARAPARCVEKGDYTPAKRDAWRRDLRTEAAAAGIAQYFGAQPSRPGLPRDGAFSLDLSLGAPVLPFATLLSRGIYFDLLVQRLDNEDRRTGEISPAWGALEHRLQTHLPVDPLSGEPFDLADGMRMSTAWSMRSPLLGFAVGRFRQAEINDTLGYGTNALGLPFGPVASSWRLAETSSGTSFMEEVEARWRDIAQQVERQRAVLETGRVAGSLAAHALAGERLAERVRAHAERERHALEAQATSVEATASRLDAVRLRVASAFQSYAKGVNAVWSCDVAVPDDQPGSCAEIIYQDIDALYGQCIAHSVASPLSEVLISARDLSGAFAPFFAAASSVETRWGGGAEFDLAAAPHDVVAFLRDSVTLGRSLRAGAVGAGKLATFFQQLAAWLDLSGACAQGVPIYAHLRAHQGPIRNIATALTAASPDLGQLEAALGRFAGDLTFHATRRDTLEALEASATDLRESYRQTPVGPGQEDRARATFLRSACPLARTAVDASLRDIYRATQVVATTTGESFVRPYLYVPADPGGATSTQATDPGWRSGPTEHGFLYSLWDSSRLRKRILDGPGSLGSTDTLVDALSARFDTFKSEELCRRGAPLVHGLALVEKRIQGRPLDAFLGRGLFSSSSGRIDFDVTLDDLSVAFDARGPHLNASKIRDLGNGHWQELSAPVVLDAAYAVERPGGSRAFRGLGTAWRPALAAPKISWMPSAHCLGGEVRTRHRFSWNGQTNVLTACLEPQTVSRLGAGALSALPPGQSPSDLLAPFRASSAGSPSFCGGPGMVWTPSELQGRPALGVWTLAYDGSAAQAIAHEGGRVSNGVGIEASWLAANADVTALTIYLVLGVETLAHQEPPRTRLEQP